MGEDEIILPSDEEELEEIAARRDEYWESAKSAIQRNLATLWAVPFNNVAFPSASSHSNAGTPSSSPARKKIKLSHSTLDSTQSPQSNKDGDTKDMRREIAQEMRVGDVSRISSVPTPSNTPSRSLRRTASPNTPFIPVSASIGSPREGTHISLDEEEGPRASSANPLLLFTPSKPSNNPSQQTLNGAQPPTTVLAPSPLQLSSPLTPLRNTSSSPVAGPGGRTSSHPARASSPHSPSPWRATYQMADQPVAGPSNHDTNRAAIHAMLQEDLENDSGRYALRTRNKRQLKPYAFDKASYQMQMRNIPEAIVHISPRRRRRESSVHFSPDHAPSSDPEVDPKTLQVEDSDDERLRRRRRSESRGARQQTEAEAQPSKTTQHQYPAWAQFPSDSDEDDIADLLARHPSNAKPKSSGDVNPRVRKRRRRLFPLEKVREKHPAEPEQEPELSDAPLRRSMSRRIVVDISEDEDAVRGNALGQDDHWAPWADLGDLVLEADIPPTSSSGGRSSDAEMHFDLRDSSSPPPPPLAADIRDELHDLGRAWPSGKPTRKSPTVIDVDEIEETVASSADNTSDHSSSASEYDRRQMRAAMRMMPKVMLNQAVQSAQSRQKDREAAGSRKSRTSESIGPPIAGQVRTKISAVPRTNAEIKGDEESEDEERSIDHSQESPQPSPVHPRQPEDPSYWRSRSKSRSRSVISISSESSEDDQASLHDEIGDDEVDEWMRRPAAWEEGSRMKRTPAGPAVERSLVDYMLTGNRTTGKSKKRMSGPRKYRSGTGGGRARLAKSGVSVSTRGARDHGNQRQTRIQDHMRLSPDENDVRNTGVSSAAHRSHGKSHHNDNHDHAPESEQRYAFDIMINAAKKGRKHKAKHTAGLYVFNGDGRLTTGRTHSNLFTVDAEADIASSVPRPKHFVPRSHGKRSSLTRTKSNIVHEEATLEDFWSQDEGPDQALPLPVSDREQSSPAPSQRISRRFAIDAGVSPLPRDTTFASDTYLGKGLLQDMLNARSGPIELPPASGYIHDVAFSHLTTIARFVEIVNEQMDKFSLLIRQDSSTMTDDDCKDWTRFLRSVCQHISWFYQNGSEEDREVLYTMAKLSLVESSKLVDAERLGHLDFTAADRLTLEVLWAVTEMAFRAGLDRINRENAHSFIEHVSRLMKYLWTFGLSDVYRSMLQGFGVSAVDYSTGQSRLAEAWVCLIHLSIHWDSTNIKGSFWDIFETTRKECSDLTGDSRPQQTSELLWNTIFTFCELSKFSINGVNTSHSHLPASWPSVEIALKTIRLTQEAFLSKHAPRQRDKYVHLLVQRCVHLHRSWHWPLGTAMPMFAQMAQMFRRRQYSDLSHESPDFPDFLCQQNLDLLFEFQETDSAFILLLKLIARASAPSIRTVKALPAKLESPVVERCLSLLIPVGSVQFEKDVPATTRESSMLFNRLSAVAVALILDHVPEKAGKRILQARRYVEFERMNMGTRYTCIRGLMYLTSILCFFKLPLDEAMDWLANMTETLVKEFRDPQVGADAVHASTATGRKSKIALCVQMLLGSVRSIIEKATQGGQSAVTRYPDPRWLDGPWVKQVFHTSFGISTLSATRLEIRRLVMTFLKAREAVVPPPSPPKQLQDTSQEESQDYYEDLDQFDFDDPKLASALGETTASGDIKELEEHTCNAFNTDVWPAINTFVIMNLNESVSSVQNFDTTSAWIQCWVRCAGVLVQNGKKTWSFYLPILTTVHGMKQSLRTKVEIRLKQSILEWDPSAYLSLQDEFLRTLLKGLVVYEVTFEHDYASLIFALDRLRHPLLAGLILEPNNDLKLTKASFLNMREAILTHVFAQLDHSLHRETEADYEAKLRNLVYLEFIVVMASYMKESYEELAITERAEYAALCQHVADSLLQYPALAQRCQKDAAFRWLSNHISQ